MLVFPAVLLLVFFVVQTAALWYDHQVALGAAREAASIAAADKGPGAAAARANARTFVLDHGLLVKNVKPVVRVGATDVTVHVRVDLKAVVAFDWLIPPVKADVTLPVEQFVRAG